MEYVRRIARHFHEMGSRHFVEPASEALFRLEERGANLLLRHGSGAHDAVGRGRVENDAILGRRRPHRGAGQERKREDLRFATEAILEQEVDSARDVVGGVARQSDDEVDEQRDPGIVEHARSFGDEAGAAAAPDPGKRRAVHRLQADLQLVESRPGELLRVLGRQALCADLGEEGERPVVVHGGERVRELRESGPVVEGRVEERHLACAFVAQRGDEVRALGNVERAQDARGARIEAERAVRSASAHRLDVGRS